MRIPQVWFWHLGLKPQDMFLASYPRSGSTWLRFILFEILTDKDVGFQNIEERLPEVMRHRGVPPVLPGGGRLVKTHERYREDYKKAVLLVRDIRDVLLSCWASYVEHGMASIIADGDFDGFLLNFLEGRALAVGSWQEHLRSWLDSPLAKSGNLMVVRYEDLRGNPEEVVRQVLQFLGVSRDLKIIRNAIENNTLQQMRAKEDRAKRAGERPALLARYRGIQEDGRFVRKGAIGGWRSKLTDAQVKIVQQYAGNALAAAGYELDTLSEERHFSSTT